MNAFIFDRPVNQLTEKYFKHLKTKNFMNRGCLCHWVNLITQVVEVANLFCWLKKSRIGRESYETLLACCAWKGTSQHLNRVIRDSSCGYFNTLCWTLHNSPNGDFIRER